MTFSASHDRFTATLSAVVCLGMLAVVAFSHNIVVSVLALVVMFIAFAYSPRGYVIEGRALWVRRLAGAARIALDDVREVRRAVPEDSQGCVRLWGSGGLFGYYGRFRCDALGPFTAYMTSRKNNVVVITGSQIALFSPDDVDGFLSALRAVTPMTTAHPVPASGTSAPAPRRLGRLPLIIGVALGMAAIGLGVAASVYSPGPPAYTLTSASLTIHDRFFPVTLKRSHVDVAGVRVVDLATEPGWRSTLRTDGFANSHYQSGWFRVANGQKVRMYRAGGERLVLLPPYNGGAAVLYQAEDPQNFVTGLRAAWAGQNAGK